MPSLVGGMSHRNAGLSGRSGRVRNQRTGKSCIGAKGCGHAARSFSAVVGLVLCSVGLLGLSGNSDAGNLSSYFWGYASTKKRGTDLVARILLAAEKYEFKDEHSSGESATSSSSSSVETEHSSVGERQMLKIDVSAGGGGSDGSGSDGAGSSSAAVPSPSDLAANGAPVYLDEVPQCAGLTASQCEDLLSGHPEILQEALSSRPTAGMSADQMAESRYSSMQGAYGGTSSSESTADTTNAFSSYDTNGVASTSSTSSTGESEYHRDVEHGATTNTEKKAYIKFKDPILQKAKERQITDEHYYKVVLVTDREKTKVVGPEGFGEVTYPFPWRYQGKQMSVGPWDCQPAGEVLSVKECCDKIVNSVPCPDDLGNCMSCHVQPGYVQGKDRVITQPDSLNVDTYNEFHYDDSSSNGDTSSTVFGSNFNGPDFSSSSANPQGGSSSSPMAPNQLQQQPRPTNVFPSYSGTPQQGPSNGMPPMMQGNYYQPSTGHSSVGHHVPGGYFDPKSGRYYSSTSIGNGQGMSFPSAGAGGSSTSVGSDGNSIHVLVEDGDDDEGGASSGPSAWTILTFVLLMLASFFIGFLVNYGLRRARKRRKRVIITDDPTNLNGGATIVPPGAVSIAPSVANADMDIESMGGGRYPISFQPRRRGSLGGNSVAYTARSAPVQYVFDDSDDDEDIEVISTSGRSYFPPDIITDPPAHMYEDHQLSSKQYRSYPRRMSGLSSSASKVMFSENNPYNESASSNLTSSFRTRSSTQPSSTIPEESDGRGGYSERDSERESEWADQSSVDTPARANSTRRVRRNSL